MCRLQRGFEKRVLVLDSLQLSCILGRQTLWNRFEQRSPRFGRAKVRMAVVDTSKPVNAMEEVGDHHVLCQRLSGSDSDNRLPRIQRLETLWLALTLPPCSFFANIVEQRNDISQTAVWKLVTACLNLVRVSVVQANAPPMASTGSGDGRARTSEHRHCRTSDSA